MKEKIVKMFGLLLFILSVLGCSSTKNSTTVKQDSDVTSEVKIYLAEFEKAVVSHDATKIMQLMDKNYVKEQHDDFLKGRTTQFLNEFFCGNIVNSNSFKCIKYDEIEGLQETNLVKENDYYKVTCEVYSKKIRIKTNCWVIKVTTINGKRVYGLVGASG
ncbi:MAG: hypothetical protein IPO21_14745 [Bacteroidales bacterium]|nr:hypothetical protein [Bacteroidales bacterium]